ncbi:MAG: Asp-tRNA(Asn)/Glu-tRNA(Gln) amidotransferase subunit GatB [Sedimentisphaerales bacterium]|nr:Asp-tRNA(Asn)/Glu-tRNA(Gln) amidotransferase subunit GatB [Sedimentisphaerales bacterium]
MKVQVVVGLEIHVQLSTQTKLFCGCPVRFAAPPNSLVCPVCLGLPGALPVLNKKAVDYAILAAMALNCQIASFTKWDRKGYYYPDLPKNYQISQYDLPLGKAGFIEVQGDDGGIKQVRIRRVHLEEDAGKNLHAGGAYSCVDLNRAGTPLLEIVTEPDITSAAQARALAVELQRIVRYLGVSEADMQKGHMRFEPNVNLRIETDGQAFRTPIVEIKNLNSFRALEASIRYEADRQVQEFLESGQVMTSGNKTTRGWDDVRQVTVLQRQKEEAEDYRYFPDPDLVPVVINTSWLDQIKALLPELPLRRQIRFVQQYGLSEYDAGVLTSDRSCADLFDKAVEAGGRPKRVCNLLTQVGLRVANERGCSVGDLGLSPVNLATLASMIEEGKVNATSGVRILEQMIATGQDPMTLARSMDLLQIADSSRLESIIDQVLSMQQKAVQEACSEGKKAQKAFNFLVGQVMQATKGQANPTVIAEMIRKRLGGA